MIFHSALRYKLAAEELLGSGGFVAGEWLETSPEGKTFQVINPATGELLAELPDLSAETTRRAIDAAHAAQRGWGSLTAKYRADLLKALHRLMVENADDLARILTLEMGKPLAEAKGEILYGASYVEWFAEEARRIYGDTIPGHQADKRIVTIKQPVGVVGVITPWNFPNAMIARKLAPALAVGCSVVAKPAAQTPLSALALAKLVERAGFPSGVFNIVPGTAAAAIGQELCTNPKIAKISFTGSTGVGKKLMRQCADDIKRMSMELGGNAPFVFFEDADLDAAVEGAMVSKFRNAGQTCVCANRIYVHEAVHDTFAAKLTEKMAQPRLSDGMVEGVTTGPLISEDAIAKGEELLADALAKGGRTVIGGLRVGTSLMFQPTFVTGADKSMRISRKEVFGPMAPLFKFGTINEVIDLANATEFGLAAYFYARDVSKIFKVAEALQYGMVGINTDLISTEVAPFGGIKQSGFGRAGSKYGIEDYLKVKYLCLSV